jgi:hypothetical protein
MEQLQDPRIVIPTGAAPGNIGDKSDVRNNEEVLRAAAQQKINLTSVEQTNLAAARPTSFFHEGMANKLRGETGGEDAIAAKFYEIFRFGSSIQADVAKAQRELVSIGVKRLKALVEIQAGLGSNVANQFKDPRKFTPSTAQAAPDIFSTTSSAPEALGIRDFRTNEQSMREAARYFNGTGSGPEGAALETTGSTLGKALSGVMKSSGTFQKLGMSTLLAWKAALDAEVTNLDFENQRFSTEAGVKTQFNSFVGVYGSGLKTLESERQKAHSQTLLGFNQYVSESARWHMIADLNMTFGPLLGVLGLNFTPFGAGNLPSDLTQASIDGKGDVWGKNAEGKWEKIWDLKKSLLNQYAKGGVMDTRVRNAYGGILDEFKPFFERFNQRQQDISFLPGGIDEAVEGLYTNLAEKIKSFNEATGEYMPIPDRKQWTEGLLKSMIDEDFDVDSVLSTLGGTDPLKGPVRSTKV